jgi:translation initiation factor IF-3
VVPLQQALAAAQQRGMDLVEIAPSAKPPVCRIVELGKFRYEQAKREREHRKAQTGGKVKEIKLHATIDDHDYEVKLRHSKEFLEKGMKVKVTLQFRGREMQHPEFGQKIMERFVNDVAGIGTVEMAPRLIGRALHMVIAPARGVRKPTAAQNQPQSGRAA